MANKDYPSGMWDAKHKTAGQPGRTESKKLYSSNSAIGRGDPVHQRTDGTWDLAGSDGDELGGISAEEKLAACGDDEILVYKDPCIVFIVQCASGVDYIQDYEGNLVDLCTTTYNTTTGRSKREANLATVGTSTGQLRILALHPRADNVLGEHADIEVEIFEHQFGDKSALAGR